MKKALLSMLFVVAFSTGLQAQVFVMSQDAGRTPSDPSNIEINVPIHFEEYDQYEDYVPLGGGLLTLTSLGLGYVLAKKRKQEK